MEVAARDSMFMRLSVMLTRSQMSSSSSTISARALLMDLSMRLKSDNEGYMEAAPAAGAGSIVQLGVIGRRELPGDIETQAGTAAAGGKKGIEDLSGRLQIDPRTGVEDLDHDPAGLQGAPCADTTRAGLERQLR